MKSKNNIDLSAAIKRAARIRKLYHQLEIYHHGSKWATQEDMLGLASDIGELGRLIMASEGRWVYEGDLSSELEDKMSDCMWWLLALSDRLDINISKALSRKLNELEANLSKSIAESK